MGDAVEGAAPLKPLGFSWGRLAVYPWAYPSAPDGSEDPVLCSVCLFVAGRKWNGHEVRVAYTAEVPPDAACSVCGFARWPAFRFLDLPALPEPGIEYRPSWGTVARPEQRQSGV